MYIGEHVDSHESLENEYKEFCIKTNIFDYYTTEELNFIINTGILPSTFNNLILDNLQTYFDIYIPPYIYRPIVSIQDIRLPQVPYTLSQKSYPALTLSTPRSVLLPVV